MSRIDIIGGVYQEKVAFPVWNELFGSGGRAANALVGHAGEIHLHTCLTDREKISAVGSFDISSIQLHNHSRANEVIFEYLHTLSTPKIKGNLQSSVVSIPDVVADLVIKFGMLECDPKIDAHYAVYDPQSPLAPNAFSASGSKAKHLAVVANKTEIRKLSGKTLVEDAVKYVRDAENAEVVVVKDGINGADVYTGDSVGHIPAFKTSNVFSLGSGDVFVAAFALAWGKQLKSPMDAAHYASACAAEYVEQRILPIKPESDLVARHEASKAGGKIYLAGPFRETGQRFLINDAREQLQTLGMQVFSPVHDIGHGIAEIVVSKDLDALRQCDAVFAILNGSSPGTVFEVGFARALDKPVYCVAQNMREVDLKLPKGSGAHIHTDYVSALFQIAWRS